jgi:hypothetical protein
MTPTITAFATSPDKGQGLAGDMRVRWALEEVGPPYDVRLVTLEMKQPAHLAIHPFGDISCQAALGRCSGRFRCGERVAAGPRSAVIGLL